MSSKLYNAFQLIRNGHYLVFFNELKKRIYSRSVSFGLKRDLNSDFKAPSAKIDIQIRPLKEDDVEKLLDTTNDPSINPRIIASQQSMVNADIPTCYVAVTDKDEPCYMQWLIGYKDNDKIGNHFEGVFPVLSKREALLEAAYNNPAYRGLRIMPRAMALIAEKAVDMEVRWVNTFVDVTNIPSLKGCQRAGFAPYLLRQDRWFLFHRTITFHSISETMTEIFYEVTEAERYNTDKKPLYNHTTKSMGAVETGTT